MSLLTEDFVHHLSMREEDWGDHTACPALWKALIMFVPEIESDDAHMHAAR